MGFKVLAVEMFGGRAGGGGEGGGTHLDGKKSKRIFCLSNAIKE